MLKSGLKVNRCPRCGSIWVCWNWMHWDLDELCKMNPGYTREELAQGLFAHECWHCGDDMGGHNWETPNRIKWGVPYWLLQIYGWVKWRVLRAE